MPEYGYSPGGAWGYRPDPREGRERREALAAAAAAPEPEPTTPELIEQAIPQILEAKRPLPSELEATVTEYLQQQMAGQAGFGGEATALMREQIAFTRKQLENLADAKELGEITGDLSPEEIEMLDTLEANAVQQLTTEVNRQLEDVMGKEVASLVSRGVLQGGIGAETMARLGEKATRIIAEGTTAISSKRIEQELMMREGTKERTLREQLATQEMAQAMAGGAYGASWTVPGMALTAGQYQTGLGAQWDISKMGTVAGLYTGQEQKAAQMAMAGMQASATETASKWGALGAGAGLIGLAKFSDYRLKTNIIYLGIVKQIPIILFQYKQDYIPDKNAWHIGVIAQQLMKVRPELVITIPIKSEPFYAVNYTGLRSILGG